MRAALVSLLLSALVHAGDGARLRRPEPTDGPCAEAEKVYAQAWGKQMECLLPWDPTTDPRYPRWCKSEQSACLKAEKELRECEAERKVLPRDWYTCQK